MATQIFPLQTQEDENLNENLNSDNSQSVVSKQSRQSAVQELPQKPNNLGRKRATVQLDNEIEEEVNSFGHLTIIIQSIQIGYFALGYSLSYLSMSFTTVFSQITLQGSETSEQGLFSAVQSIGQVVGAVLTYFLLKFATRNQSLIIADICGILSILQVIPNREMILAFRFFFGVCLGISCIIMPVYVKELCPQKYYEKQAVMAGFQVAGGLLFANILGLGYLNPDLVGEGSHYWQFIFAIPAIISFYRFIVVSIIYRMDSPISLLKKNKNHLVKQIIAKIYKSNVHDQAMRKAILRLQYDEEHQEGLLSIFSKKHRTTLAIGCTLMFGYTWSGLFAVFSYSSQIFAAMADGDQTLNTIFVLILGFAQFTPAFISSYVYGRWGKRILLLGGLIFMIVCQVLIIGLSYSDKLSAVIVNQVIGPNVRAYYQAKNIITMYFTMTALTLGPITWSMTPEINPSEGTYFSFVTLFSWQLLLLYIFPSMNESLEMSGCFIVFTILTALCLVIFYFFVKETKGLNHAEIDKLYGKDHHH